MPTKRNMDNDSFRRLENFWYQKLKSEGFEDIENIKHSNRPLKEWHSFRMNSERIQIFRFYKSEYQKQIDDFSNHPEFMLACESLVSHGNSKFTKEQVALIWQLHIEGLTIRAIAKRFNRVKSRVDDVIKGLREWMNLL